MTLAQESRKQDSAVVIIGLATVSHPDLADDIRAADNGEDVTSRGDTYLAAGWSIQLPELSEESSNEVNITIGNVDPDICLLIESSLIPPTIKIEIVMSSDPDTVELSFESYIMRDVVYDSNTITGRLSLPDMKVEPMPFQSFTQNIFPGIF